MPAADWDDLRRELDLWAAQSRHCVFWWRDDDATAPGAALTRLLDLSDATGVDLTVAVVPAVAEDRLAIEIDSRPRATIIQHGFAHSNHAALGGRAVECGGERPLDRVMDDLRAGLDRLETLFGARFEPILAPPWNRIKAPVIARLPALGYRGISAFGPRIEREPAANLVAINTHVDPLSWRDGPRFAGHAKVLGLVIDEMRTRRLGGVDPGEPLGLLTHHRDHDEETWQFVEGLLRLTASHGAARWVSVRDAFGPELIAPLGAAR